MDLGEREKSGFAAATEMVKQLLALATASIGGIIVLFDDKDVTGIDFGAATCAVFGGLSLFAASVVFGLFALGTLAGQLGQSTITNPSIYAGPVLFMTRGQMIAYGAGVITVIIAVV